MPLPTTATVVGTTIDVVGIDIAEDGEHLTARCDRMDAAQDLHLSDLVFPPDTTTGWIHAALSPLSRPHAAPDGHATRMGPVLGLTGPSTAAAHSPHAIDKARVPTITTPADDDTLIARQLLTRGRPRRQRRRGSRCSSAGTSPPAQNRPHSGMTG